MQMVRNACLKVYNVACHSFIDSDWGHEAENQKQRPLLTTAQQTETAIFKPKSKSGNLETDPAKLTHIRKPSIYTLLVR